MTIRLVGIVCDQDGLEFSPTPSVILTNVSLGEESEREWSSITTVFHKVDVK